MNHFDNLPKRDRNHAIEEMAVTAFQARLSESGSFILQGPDRKDYGTDCQIEVIDRDCATNVRLHAQIKGTERALNVDGSVSVEISRANLNYLLVHPHSFYVCYHIPSSALRFCFAESVLRQYEHRGKGWTKQQSLTVSFTEILTVEQLDRLAVIARSAASASRDRRVAQVSARPTEIVGIVRSSPPEIHVPTDSAAARQMLEELYSRDEDDLISASFDRFAAVLGANSDAMGLCYMAEVNLGMARRSQFPSRIEAAVDHFISKLDKGIYQPGSLYYTIGNAFSALDDERRAKASYEAALADPDFRNSPSLAAQGHKNLGTSFERLGEAEKAVEHYREALRQSPDLAEAHNALGSHYLHIGQYADALEHFDRAIFTEPHPIKALAASGWRVNILFNLEEGQAAFRDINSLLGYADREPWIWSWCGRQVATFGRSTPENARQALSFWLRYLRANPDHLAARVELLLTTLYLRDNGQDIGKSYYEFREELEHHVAHFEAENAALLWDRLGHWAQNEGDWIETERCYRKAYNLQGGHYGYCLGTALNFLGRFTESLPILLEQAQRLQPDAISWFQVGVAYASLNHATEAADAYEKALMLDPNYDLAMFNLGGVHWNNGDFVEAAKVWKVAMANFPDHELTAKLRRDFPWLT